MVRLKIPRVRILVFFLIVLLASFAAVQAHLTEAKPERAGASLKTIAHVIVHAHPKPAQLNKGS
jgi:hypothetical protein